MNYDTRWKNVIFLGRFHVLALFGSQTEKLKNYLEGTNEAHIFNYIFYDTGNWMKFQNFRKKFGKFFRKVFQDSKMEQKPFYNTKRHLVPPGDRRYLKGQIKIYLLVHGAPLAIVGFARERALKSACFLVIKQNLF